ncbi:7746_t:CDS:1, partial [Racocetra fulgida]
YRIWSIAVHQQQLEGLFNRYDIKVHPNMDAKLQESCIQLSSSDGGLQNISQDMLRNIQQDIKNSEISKNIENSNNSREEQTYEILN